MAFEEPGEVRLGNGWMLPAHVGAVCVALTFFVSTTSTSTTTVNGRVTSEVYRDTMAIGGGAGAILFGLIALALGLRAKAGLARLAYPIVVILLGGYKLAAGFGAFLPTPHASEDVAMPQLDLPARHPAIDAAAGPCADQTACFDLGEKLSAAKQIEEAFAAYARACELGSKGGCNNGAVLFLDDKPTRALPLLEKGCSLEHPQSCSNLGFLLLSAPDGIAKDENRAAGLFANACEQKDGLGCSNMGFMMLRGMGGVEKHPKRALALMIRGCELDHPKGCSNAGSMLVDGEGVPKDRKRGLTFLAKGCEGDVMQCRDYAISLEVTDPKGARAAYTKACDGGEPKACNNLGLQWRDGKRGPKDVAKGTAYLKQACDGGIDVACQNLK